MSTSTDSDTIPIILVVSDSTSSATLVEKLVGEQFGKVFTCTNTDQITSDFEQLKPDVLVLAFNSLEKSERSYLGLYRESEKIHRLNHRTIVLCNKEEVKEAYICCRDGLFDDYVLFWPITLDAPRLLMAIHHALREVATLKTSGPTPGDFAAQARRLAELETLFDLQIAEGKLHIEETSRAINQAELDIGASLDGFSQRLIQGTHTGEGVVNDTNQLENEITRLKQDEIHNGFRKAVNSIQPLTQWAQEFKEECTPHMESIRVMNTMAEKVRPTVLVVDDDEFQRKINSQVLGSENFRIKFAANGIEALGVLRHMRPDLILMDFMMPDMDGMEANRRLKAMPRFANIPVIMITGNSNKNVVFDAKKMGVTDFVVKPFTREVLIEKVTRALAEKDLSSSQ